jgi:hypothetical protein
MLRHQGLGLKLMLDPLTQSVVGSLLQRGGGGPKEGSGTGIIKTEKRKKFTYLHTDTLELENINNI